MVNGGWFVGSRGRFVSWCRSIFGFTRVLNISNISRVVISDSVGDSLGAAIRKKDIVLAIGSISITSFGLAVFHSRVVILGSIGIVVDRGSIRVDRGRVTISRGRERGRWGGHSSGNKGSERNNGLK